jgi:hypothetical protein
MFRSGRVHITFRIIQWSYIYGISLFKMLKITAIILCPKPYYIDGEEHKGHKKGTVLDFGNP